MRSTIGKVKALALETIRNPREFPAYWVRSRVQRCVLSPKSPLALSCLLPSFADLSSMPPDNVVPPLDQKRVDLNQLTDRQRAWRESGVLHLSSFMPDELMSRYERVRETHQDPGGWTCPVPYMHVPELLALSTYRPLMLVLKELLSREMALSLSLTGWISTDRAWHQDDYLNPDFVNSWYAAVWIALEDIHPDSGPFQYIEGSHRWPILRGDRVRDLLSRKEARQPKWPIHGERFTTPALEKEIKRTGLPVTTYLPKRGDVLIWHGRLVHQGSRPKVPGTSRRALICHFNSIEHRRDWPNVGYTADGSAYFLHDIPLDRAEA